jgi:hypothetical protein
VQQISSEGTRNNQQVLTGLAWKASGQKENFLIRSYCSVTLTPDLAGYKQQKPKPVCAKVPRRCQQLKFSDGFNNLGFLRDRVYCSNGDRYLQRIWLKICLKLKDYP